jgi:hypothetical protein
MARTTRSALSRGDAEDPPAELPQGEVTSQGEPSNSTDPQEAELRLLREQHEQDLRQLALLQARRDRDETRRRIERLVIEERPTPEDQEIQEVQEVDSHNNESHTVAGTKHPRSEENPPPPRGRPRTREPPLYKGLSLKEYEHFIQICEKTFRVDPFSYATEDSRVAYASQYLDGVPETEWNRFEHDEGLDHTWKEFKDFLLKTLKDPVNRKKDASQRLTDARQRDTQSVRDFAHYLDVLQDQLYTRAENPDARRIELLRTRVKDEIRRESDRHANVPEKYYEYVNHLANMEENVNKATGRKINKNTGSDNNTSSQNQRGTGNRGSRRGGRGRGGRGRGFRRGGGTQNSSTEPKTGDEEEWRKSVTCYRCQQKGHYANECTAPAPVKNTNTQ